MKKDSFAGRFGFDRERVQAGLHLGGEQAIDDAVALDATLAAERLRHHDHAHMGGLSRNRPYMTSVARALVHHIEAFGRKRLGERVPNPL